MTQEKGAPLTNSQRFWTAVLVIGGYLLFGGWAAMGPRNLRDGGTVFVISVLSTMGPLVGWVVKGLFASGGATGKPDDPVHIEPEGQP